MFSQDKFQQALHFAALAHGDQKYSGKPYSYIVHVSLVAMEMTAAIANAIASNIQIDADFAVQCAILHDVLEDTEVQYPQLREVFGQHIADGVLALTKDKTLDKPKQMIDGLARIKEQPKEVWMVKLADRITNLQPPPGHWSSDKLVDYKREAILIYDELKDADEFLARRLYEKIETYNITQ